MFKILAILFLLFFCRVGVKAQQSISLEGKVIEKKTSFPLPYATIKLLNGNKISFSNNEGIFVLNTLSHDADTIMVSSLGFIPLKVATSSLSKNSPLVFALEENIISLNEVTISPIKIVSLISDAIKASKAKSNSDIILTGYYKECVKRDSLLSKYADGIISYYIERTNRSSPKIVLRVIESRKKEVVLPEEDDKMNGLNTPINIKDLANFSNPVTSTILDSTNFQAYQYELAEIEDHNKSTYIINFQPIVGSAKSLYMGKLYIDKETLLIIGLDYSVAPLSIPYLKTVNLFGFRISNTSRSLSLRYKIDNDDYYLSYVGRSFGMSVLSKKYNQVNDFKSEFWLINVQTHNCIPFITNYSKNALYKRGTDYKTEFWNNNVFGGSTEEELKFLK